MVSREGHENEWMVVHARKGTEQLDIKGRRAVPYDNALKVQQWVVPCMEGSLAL